MHIIGSREGIRTTCTIQLYRTYSGSSAQQLGGITGILQAENTSQFGQAEVADHIGHVSDESKHGGEQRSNESAQSAQPEDGADQLANQLSEKQHQYEGFTLKMSGQTRTQQLAEGA